MEDTQYTEKERSKMREGWNTRIHGEGGREERQRARERGGCRQRVEALDKEGHLDR